jgi:hypothetical protein
MLYSSVSRNLKKTEEYILFSFSDHMDAIILTNAYEYPPLSTHTDA